MNGAAVLIFVTNLYPGLIIHYLCELGQVGIIMYTIS